MAVEIRFETDSEEFLDNGAAEVMKVLREIQEDILRGHETSVILDDDGKVIGRWECRLPFSSK